MQPDRPQFPDYLTSKERPKSHSEEEIDELELAGGVEGGMPAGAAGGPGEGDKKEHPKGAPLSQSPRSL
jgi:hypothetical protein